MGDCFSKFAVLDSEKIGCFKETALRTASKGLSKANDPRYEDLLCQNVHKELEKDQEAPIQLRFLLKEEEQGFQPE